MKGTLATEDDTVSDPQRPIWDQVDNASSSKTNEHAWLLDVLADLTEYARRNGLSETECVLNTTREVIAEFIFRKP